MCRLLVGGDCIFVKSGWAGKPVSTPFGVLPRRFISSNVAACIKVNSPSLKCLTALRRFLGRTCRCDAVSLAASVADYFGGDDAFLVSGAASHAVIRPLTI